MLLVLVLSLDRLPRQVIPRQEDGEVGNRLQVIPPTLRKTLMSMTRSVPRSPYEASTMFEGDMLSLGVFVLVAQPKVN